MFYGEGLLVIIGNIFSINLYALIFFVYTIFPFKNLTFWGFCKKNSLIVSGLDNFIPKNVLCVSMCNLFLSIILYSNCLYRFVFHTILYYIYTYMYISHKWCKLPPPLILFVTFFPNLKYTTFLAKLTGYTNKVKNKNLQRY